MNEKTKLLLISDHAKTSTGVAVQSNYLVQGLIATGKYQIVQLGAAVYHEDYSTQKISEDFSIIPINGFGDKDTIRSMLVSYEPDAMIIFSDSRFFGHIFAMEDEIHQVCPIMWWHVWDNRPVPKFNKELYDCVDQINCISELTYSLCKEVTTENKLQYIPHSFESSLFYQMKDEEIKFHKEKILGPDFKNMFVCSWVNRNIRRKRPADVLKSWQIFLQNLNDNRVFKSKEPILLMHTDPYDPQGYNLVEIAKQLNILSNVRFSDQIVEHDKINVIHNISDIHLNIAHSEGFGLSTLEAMMTGTPIVATLTGGLIRQLIDKKTFEVNGIALKPTTTMLSGSQTVPYLNEDIVDVGEVAAAIMGMYCMSDQAINEIGQKAKKYALETFSYEKMISDWDCSIAKTLSSWKENYQRVRLEEVV